MKRKLIDVNVINELEKKSINAAMKEINESCDVLAKKLKLDSLNVHCMNESEVTFVTPEKTYIHATYTLDNKNLLLENIKELVVNEDSEKVANNKFISNMLEAILEEKSDVANEMFENYVNMPLTKRVFKENINAKKVKSKNINESKRFNSEYSSVSGLFKKSKIEEFKAISENVQEFLNYKKGSPLFNKVSAKYDENNNISAVKMPRLKIRNEGKILSFAWKTPNAQVTYQRTKAKGVIKENNFLRAINDLRKANAISDTKEVEVTLKNIVGAWPSIVYLTHSELANMIKEALQASESNNYDDNTCLFMAEGILRTAHHAYSESVEKVFNIANVESNENFEDYQETCEKLFPVLDEQQQKEVQSFIDVYKMLDETLNVVAKNNGDKVVKAKISEALESLNSIISGEKELNYNTLEESNNIIKLLTEAFNIPMASNTIGNYDKPHTSLGGDHPILAKKAKVDAFPSKFNGDYKGAVTSDGSKVGVDDSAKSAYTAGGKDIFPSLRNPYVQKDVIPQVNDKDPNTLEGDNLATNQGNDTWPNLTNPYIPKNGMTLDQSFMHLNASDKN